MTALTLALLTLSVVSHCPAGSVLRVHADFTTSCIKCPEGCAICTLNSFQEPSCIFCEDGFFSSKDGRCDKCYENCASCVGPEINECRSLKPGYYFDGIQMKIRQCEQRGCASCGFDGQCYACSEGFYLAETSTKGLKICKSCDIPNCIVCGEKDNDVKSMKVVGCQVCRSGFSQMNDRCEACPENCQFCVEGSKECILCKPGFHVDPKQNVCSPFDVAHCNSIDPEGKCTSCENRFYLSEGQCFPCQKAFPNCSYCKVDIATNILSCLNCESGFSMQDNSCKKCGDKCNHCTPDKCFACQKGYFYDEAARQCQRCDLGNCELCKSASVCENCMPGFFFDETAAQCVKSAH